MKDLCLKLAKCNSADEGKKVLKKKDYGMTISIGRI